MKKLNRKMAISAGLVALFSALCTAAVAATPPSDRTYFTVTMGLADRYGLGAECLTFSEDRVCSLDGSLCGNWKRIRTAGKRGRVAFDMTLPNEGDPIQIDGQARIDFRGSRSALGGTGRARTDGGGQFNFSFAAREVSAAICPLLVASFKGNEPGSEEIVGSGNVVTESRDVRDFTEISLRDSGRLVIERTGRESLSIAAEDNIMPLLESEVRNGRLELGIQRGSSVRTRVGYEYRLTVRDLDTVSVSGSASVEASGIDSNTWTIDLDGSSSVTVAGQVRDQKIRLSGSSSYRAFDLRSRTASVDLSGNSHSAVRVSQRLEGDVRNAAVLEYRGNPQVDVRVSDVAVVRKAGD